MTQVDLADLAVVGDRTVHAAERGTAISMESARRIASAVGLSYVQLLRPAPETTRRRLVACGHAPLPDPDVWIDREPEAEHVADALRGARGGLACCIAGPSGIGKTALARRLANELADSFPDGVVWMSALGAEQVPDIAAQQADVARALGFESQLPERSRVEERAFHRAFQARLWSRRRLLVLDDVASLRGLSCYVGHPGAWAIVTTVRRHVADSFDGLLLGLGPLREAESLELLGAHVPDDRLDDDPEGTRTLLRHLGGVPRSLGIAAGILRRERFTSPGVLAYRLAAEGPGGSDPRVGSDPDASFQGAVTALRARMSERAWTALEHLAVFGDRAFLLRWAVAACGTSEADALASLGELTDRYVLMEQCDAPRGPRFILDGHARQLASWTNPAAAESAWTRLSPCLAGSGTRLAEGPEDRAGRETFRPRRAIGS